MGLYGKIRLMKMALVENCQRVPFEYGYLVGQYHGYYFSGT